MGDLMTVGAASELRLSEVISALSHALDRDVGTGVLPTSVRGAGERSAVVLAWDYRGMGSTPAERLVEELRSATADADVLAAIAAVPREAFVPDELRERAYDNVALPIGRGQTISQPLVVARMAELLRLGPEDRVLDVGTGSGYHAAVLSRLARHVWSIERLPELSAWARANLHAAGADNVTVLVGDGSRGLPEQAPFDAINVAAAAWPEIPPELERQLTPGGRLVAPVGASGQQLVLVERDAGGELRRTPLDPVRFVPLIEG